MDDDEEMLAVHEAGHAVAFYRLFPRSHALEVTIEPDDDLELGGYLWPAHDISVIEHDTPEEVSDELIRNRATVACAGYAATILFGWADVDAIAFCNQDFEQAGDLVEDGKVDAMDLLARDANTRAIRIIADELRERRTLDSELVPILMDVADGETTMEEYQEFLAIRDVLRNS